MGLKMVLTQFGFVVLTDVVNEYDQSNDQYDDTSIQ